MQKLIFRKNKELIMSKNGQVTIGKWDYFGEAKSLLIDRGANIILCNEGFIGLLQAISLPFHSLPDTTLSFDILIIPFF